MIRIANRSQLVLITIAVLVCVVGGASFSSRPTGSDQPEADTASETATIPPRTNVESRSTNPTLEELEQLEALGYVDATYDPRGGLRGVLLNDETRTSPGYNFYTLRGRGGARLIDMLGRELYRWETDDEGQWLHAELLSSGDVIVTVPDRRLSRYDKHSRRLWSVRGRFHHDFCVDEDEIYALTRIGRVVEQVHSRSDTLVDLIQVLSLDGTVKREISILDILSDSPYRFLLPSLTPSERARTRRQLDVLHVNHIEVFDGRLADRHPIYKKGNILLSARNNSTIFILDGETLEIAWIWGPTNLTFQHQPTLLENGHLLVFDNGLTRSRVIEVDPLSGKIVWAYAPESGFFSRLRGSNQRLANGNTLITESDTGYVREITRERKLVWEFANPAVNSKQERAVIWRMTRVDPAALDFLETRMSARTSGLAEVATPY